MKHLFSCILGLLCLSAVAQNTEYFQQEVHYQIEVRLDDIRHRLDGKVDLSYTNHAPDSLPYLYFHLWTNAYGRQSSAFSRQQLRIGKTEFHFAKDSDLGGYDSVAFFAGAKRLPVDPEPEHPDIVKVWLPRPLAPGETVELSVPFGLKIPASFSRMGHIATSYQITQWYPKPAVYDAAGWHPMPYLDMGEFYSEFGSFEVAITLPENYVVGATGALQDSLERAWLLEKIKAGPPKDDEFPESSSTFKTIRYKAEKVHDFAWFADKRFQVRYKEIELPGGKKVETWAMFTQEEAKLWANAINYLERSLKFYSELVGPYPYPQMTAVFSALSAGGGMEYPMVTVIDKCYNAEYLDLTITHEVGHNWFYGVLAFNERQHPWLDEGFNQYYENRYAAKYYYDHPTEEAEEYYLELARKRHDQAARLPSDSLSEPNYWLAAYDKPAMAFRYLEGWLGTDTFDQIMQEFYLTWQFKHPGPEDVRMFWEAATGQDLEWLFEGLIGTNGHLDYAIREVKEKQNHFAIAIKNKGDITGPYPVSGMKDGEVVKQQWYAGSDSTKVIHFPIGDYDRIIIDEGRYLPEFDRKDNQMRTDGLFRKVEPLNPVVKFDQGAPHKTNFYLLPIIMWNNYDKGMIGFSIYNNFRIEKPFEFNLIPAVSLVTRELGGLGFFRYNWYPESDLLHRVRIGIEGKQFHYNYNWDNEYYLQYRRVSPYLDVRLPFHSLKSFRQGFVYRSIWVSEEQAQFSIEGEYLGNEWSGNWIHRLEYWGADDRALHPFAYRVGLEQQSYTSVFGSEEHYLKLELGWMGGYTYQPDRNVSYRLFAGVFLDNTRRDAGGIFPGAINLTGQGYQGHDDYSYSEIYLGRNDNRGLWAQQISLRDGAFKNAFGAPFQGQSGNSNSFLIALNLQADLPQDLPGDLPVKPYFDLAFSRDARPTAANLTFQDQLWWSGGFCLDFSDGAFGIYFPLVHSKNLRDLYAQDGKGGYFSTVTFNLDISRIGD